MDKQQPVVLMILDVWGISKQTEGNAIARAALQIWTSCLANMHIANCCAPEKR